MKKIFADTFYWIALLNPKDDWYDSVIKVSQSIANSQIITTEEVLTDGISMNIMNQLEIIEVLTHDQHFTQEGFIILF
ncbi:hypothetical protein H6G54_03460 [Anabaena cylindrica FACHB-243]|uniref:PIN domain-containing protein n=1 Tax=Anabaena cylindrica (strain ATCC 27899 / PCC 7122) TaxID=272123 RepID=K9ZJF1_ANACC|nr:MULTISPECIES: hypothetical protein [Anabaena]AFZ59358.1 hypothetical protein Anacy_3987 [Anabaena cylindrica PCC 7122]MBD2416782.1 hypothetical protein [Anabaena cylindrica FACHB-243]MBY5280258.1 hypothetical protein [Anabaena sp. CCAP 1446/1C]MBY5308530.1 hypothetical protein [Anabaena sp. CCAP 1446/1C]MCM2405276.1 hypothetical protein [Anabaena sp. CCAP 1446/1C]